MDAIAGSAQLPETFDRRRTDDRVDRDDEARAPMILANIETARPRSDRTRIICRT